MKYPRLIALKVEDDVEREARAQAEAADRTLSNYLRGIIRDEVRRRAAASTSVSPALKEQAHG